MSNHRQNYTPERGSTPWRYLVVPGVFIVAMILWIGWALYLINTNTREARDTAEQKLSAALDDAYRSGQRDALRQRAKVHRSTCMEN